MGFGAALRDGFGDGARLSSSLEIPRMHARHGGSPEPLRARGSFSLLHQVTSANAATLLLIFMSGAAPLPFQTNTIEITTSISHAGRAPLSARNKHTAVHYKRSAAIQNGTLSVRKSGTVRVLLSFIENIINAGDFAMDQRDLELLDKQMRAINRAPRRDGVIIVTVLMVFIAGMTLGSLLAGSANEPTRVAANDVAPVSPEGLPLAMRQ
jgi:hypothetical protein